MIRQRAVFHEGAADVARGDNGLRAGRLDIALRLHWDNGDWAFRPGSGGLEGEARAGQSHESQCKRRSRKSPPSRTKVCHLSGLILMLPISVTRVRLSALQRSVDAQITIAVMCFGDVGRSLRLRSS